MIALNVVVLACSDNNDMVCQCHICAADDRRRLWDRIARLDRSLIIPEEKGCNDTYSLPISTASLVGTKSKIPRAESAIGLHAHFLTPSSVIG